MIPESIIELDNNNNIDNSTHQKPKINVPLMGQNLSSNNDQIDSIADLEESFPSFIQSVCCPSFSFLSISFIISLIQIIVYIAMVCLGIEQEANKLFAPTVPTLELFGMKNIKAIKSGHIWRWVTSVFIHSTFIHLTINIISQIILGSYIEAIIGQWKTDFCFLSQLYRVEYSVALSVMPITLLQVCYCTECLALMSCLL